MPEDRLAVDPSEDRRLAWLHRDAVKHDLAAANQHVQDQIALADRAAAGKDEHVVRRARRRPPPINASSVSGAVGSTTGTPPCAATIDDSV